jgi:hypothetical protein
LGQFLSGGLNLGFVVVGFSLSIAVMRYRLYDIDFIIRRTLVYSLLTTTLVLVYFGTVVITQTLFGGAIRERNQLGVVVSTLAIAGLFNPLRRRLQTVIDRRFYRRKYDAEQILAAFAASSRGELDWEQLTAELLHAVQETVQPELVNLWVRPPSRGSSRIKE